MKPILESMYGDVPKKTLISIIDSYHDEVTYQIDKRTQLGKLCWILGTINMIQAVVIVVIL